MTFATWPWRHWCAQRDGKIALRFDNESLNWSTLCQRVDRLAAGFQAQGVKAEDGVALCARNSADAVLAWLALLQCGARILPLNPRLPASLVGELLPASAEGVLSLIPFGENDGWLLSLPLFHVSGQGILWRWLLAGAQMAVSERPLAEALAHCTHASLVPTQLWRLLNDNQPLSLKAVLLGGAAIPAELTEQAAARGIRTFCGYGLTEFASTVCAREANGGDDVGTPLPGRELRLVEGEIWLRASSMAAGYWRNGRLTPLVNAEGWFATRDRGELHDGRLRVIGRLDNLFFSGGEGIQPEEVERVIVQHPLVNQVFVVPVDDAEFGQRPVAVVEGEPSLDLPQLAAWAKDKLAGFQQPCRWLRLPEAMTRGGIKVSRHQLSLWVASQ